jgi:hypothetical protein
MSDRAKHTWFRRPLLAGAIFATSAVVIAANPLPAMAQVYPTYSHQFHGNPYHSHNGWVSNHRGWHRGWSEDGGGQGGWRHGDRGRAGRDFRGDHGWSGGGQGGRGAVHSGAGVARGGDVRAYLGALGAHYR